MNIPFTVPSARRVILCLALCGSGLLGSQAWAQPSSRPLLANQTGAKPNLMVALDNSGSMSYPHHDSYNVINDFENVQVRVCPTPYSNVNSTTLATFNAGRGGDAIYSGGTGGTYTCYRRNTDGSTTAGTTWSVAATPARNYMNWSGQRSADVNPVYYDPTVRYLPRVDGSGAVVTPRDPLLPATVPTTERDATYNVVWVSNQLSANFRYTVLQRDAAPNDYRIYHSMYASNAGAPPAGNSATRNSQGHVNTLAPGGFTSRYNLTSAFRIPQHIAYTATPVASTATTFSYAICSNVVRNTLGQETGCAALTAVNVTPGATATYTIPTPNNRSDCTANSCTNAQEVANILNWYRYYSTRQLATSTAIGLALLDTDANGVPNNPSRFDDKLRIGYMPINDTTIAGGGNTNLAIVNPPGSPASVPTVSRGVRTLQRGSAANTQLYGWLNTMLSRGGTPLHNSVEKVADYYLMRNGVTENAWLTDPTNAAGGGVELSCRRSFNLLFSDGAWSPPPIAPSPAGPDFDNIAGPVIEKRHPVTNALEDSLQYNPTGINTFDGRLKYTPFPSSGTGGLADITANYFWRTDMRSAYNDVQTRAGQPAFWQNMTTYTVGYQIQPSGDLTLTGLPVTGLTFDQIDQYRTQYILSGFVAAAKPSWPTVDLLATTTQPQTRVDDFIHAGYTGGARSFSAQTGDDVKGIFNTILAEILSASGRDAGVSVSSGGDSSTLAGQLKYTVSYRTLDNSGNILARALDANGEETGVTQWSAEPLMPAHAARRVFTMHDTNQPINFIGDFTGLPSDVQAALRQGPDAARVPNDARFINYLRGDNNATDTANRLFRQRASKIAAMVNPPSVLMNYARDYNYDLITAGGVDGWDSYKAFAGRKAGYPSSLFVSTNAGVMHSFDATTGTEQAAFMPRRSLSRMLAFAKEPYNFEYVLDGPLSQNDVFNRGFAVANSLPVADQWRAWRHLAVGSGGRGEQLIYAVNSPFIPGSPPSRIPNREDFLWETGPDIVNAADGSDVTLGYIANPARSGQTEDLSDVTDAQRGRWIVAVNNGHYNGESNGEKAGLVVLDALTGDVVRTIPLPAGYSAGRGLSGVTLLRNYGLHDRVVAAYAGDSNGHMWRFNLTGDPSTWHVEHNAPLFTVPGYRPIFGAPAWQPHSEGGFIVVFATGMMLEESDLDDLGDQSIYGIWDRMDVNGTMVGGPFAEVTVAQLQEQRVLPATATDRNNVTYYGITNNEIDWGTQHGWRMPLENVHQTEPSLRAGERSIAEVQNIGTSVQITTTVLRRAASTEMCTISDLPANYLYLLNAQTASAGRSRSFDVTGDTRLDPFAVAYLPRGGFSRGVSVTKFYSRADGTPLSTNVLPAPLNPSDPNVDLGSEARPMGVGADGEFEASPEGAATRCRNIRSTHMGTEANSIQGGVACPTTGWSRTQFQLSAPPAN